MHSELRLFSGLFITLHAALHVTMRADYISDFIPKQRRSSFGFLHLGIVGLVHHRRRSAPMDLLRLASKRRDVLRLLSPPSACGQKAV